MRASKRSIACATRTRSTREHEHRPQQVQELGAEDDRSSDVLGTALFAASAPA
jgi:hypothetical protein